MAKIVHAIQQKVQLNQFEFSEHAVTQSIMRAITVQEIREAIETAEIVEEYPQDKYGPSLLLLGYTAQHRPLHVQCSHPDRPLVKIITLYQPDPARWINDRIRRVQS